MTETQCETKKPGRNDPCPCGSGTKYRYCCTGKEPRTRLVTLDQECAACGGQLEVDIGKDMTGLVANAELPLKNFCKDNDFYWFSTVITINQMLELSRKLREGQLTIRDLMETHKSQLTKELVLGLLDDAEEL